MNDLLHNLALAEDPQDQCPARCNSRPMNRTVPVSISRMRKIKGWSALMYMDAERTINTPVTAAASVMITNLHSASYCTYKRIC